LAKVDVNLYTTISLFILMMVGCWGIEWDGAVYMYIDTAMLFSLRSAHIIFIAIADVVQCILAAGRREVCHPLPG